MERRSGYRLVFVVVVVLSGAVLSAGALSGDGGDATASAGGSITGDGETVAPPRDGITVVATDSNTWLGRESDGPRANAELVAVGPDGERIYYNDSHTRYWDVDPVEGTDATVEYVYADHLEPEDCGGEEVCTRNGIERVNLTTGEVTEVFSRVTPGKHSTRWHDADRIDGSTIAVADIERDRVFVVNTTTNNLEWSWNAQNKFPVADSGGPYPEDWTHLNDVEVLEDGRIMVSLRNHDQVVFLDREEGLLGNRTLGSDDDHDVVYEQHNPDYIPAERGGPSVLVADSENNRVVEYRNENEAGDGAWERTWTWSDGELQWPRDADRLPNGHTLITDSNGNRVIEVDGNGEVVWTLPVAFPYESERLGTGDESAGGPAREADGNGTASGASGGAGESGGESESGAEAGESSGGADNTDDAGFLAGLLSGPTVNAVMYVTPVWMGLGELLALVVLVVAGLGWLVAELRWSPLGATVRSPVDLEWRR
ncbi:arylsulfotransferase (asst) (plasmid) [Halorarum halophilum]|uniref:Arylsulfotransferase (Asst) n=1 Tax=Halorarum halophilum TaxID=2743090 RepID=A0A7D5KPP8_9EURY|nr:arylsulfotransferase family protein [Halobaculum halophilum]QLG29722.1 arylsulfotransferase (asst) [Halobaculum halophilum]